MISMKAKANYNEFLGCFIFTYLNLETCFSLILHTAAFLISKFNNLSKKRVLTHFILELLLQCL